MAGEYYKWLARDVKPEEKRELTREEKIRNWWYYHKWHVLVALVVLFLMGDVAADIIAGRRNQPDYTFAYVGSSYLPEGAVTQLTEALAQKGEDLNGNGKVQVALHQYIAYPQETADGQISSNQYSMLQGAQVQLIADITNCESFFFLMEDPARFQEDYQVLINVDGSYPEEGEENLESMYREWSDCPVLENLPLGTYTVEVLDLSYTGESRDVLQGLYIGRRGFWDGKTCKNPEGCEVLWNKLIQGTAE